MKSSFVLPDGLEPAVRHPKATPPGEPITLHHSVCFGCGADAPIGLHLRIFAGDGARVAAQMEVREWMQGGPGVIHGGVLSAAFDEVMGTAPLMIGRSVVTAHLEIDFAKPIPLGSTLRFTGEVLGSVGRKIYTKAVADLGDRDQPVAGAHALFIAIDARQHFARYAEFATDESRI